MYNKSSWAKTSEQLFCNRSIMPTLHTCFPSSLVLVSVYTYVCVCVFTPYVNLMRVMPMLESKQFLSLTNNW